MAARLRAVTRLLGPVILAILAAICDSARAEPWLSPGDEGLRSDIQRLADAGILRGPVTTWPLSWPDIARDVAGADTRGLDEATLDALLRVQRRSRAAAAHGLSRRNLRVAASYAPTTLRAFADTPREEGEIATRVNWMGDHVAFNLQASYSADPDDGQSTRLDGSYIGVNVGNFMVSAGFFDRWWGPGWDGSLILSTNARPVPSLTLERNYTDPFESKLLSWMGPWRASIAVGESQDDDAPLRHVRFLAARVNFKPRSWLEFGVSRTAQWCGGDRECGWDTFTDLLLGRDNQVENGAASLEQPGNQMAGYDVRLRSPWRRLPLAFYSQWIGEDEAGGLPSKFLGLFGLESWGSTRLGGYRLRVEYADTACNFSREEPEFNCAYRNSIYPQGYSYRGRPIGHAIDNDARLFSVGGILNLPDGEVLSLTARRAELNRDGGVHAISATPLDVDNVELTYTQPLGAGRLQLGVGYFEPGLPADSDSDVHGFVTWQQGF